MCGHCGCQETKLIEIEKDILTENQGYADKNREFFKQNHCLSYNFVSSPGSGKTSLLVKTIEALKQSTPLYVIEGDQQTDIDAKRIAQTGAKVIQVNTGTACHLDAHHIGHAIQDLDVKPFSLMFIENVGNLVCPALFDLGEKDKIVIMSVTEGDDKPLKYPYMFEKSSLMLINKIDLLPYVDFDVERCIEYAHRINPKLEVIECSVKQEEGIKPWLAWLQQQINRHIA